MYPPKMVKGHPTILLTGKRATDGKRLTLAMGLGIRDFRSTDKPVGMFGVLIEGNMLSFLAKAVLDPGSLIFIDAKATFDQAGMQPGAPVRGEVEFKIMKFAGGDSPKISWQE